MEYWLGGRIEQYWRHIGILANTGVLAIEENQESIFIEKAPTKQPRQYEEQRDPDWALADAALRTGATLEDGLRSLRNTIQTQKPLQEQRVERPRTPAFRARANHIGHFVAARRTWGWRSRQGSTTRAAEMPCKDLATGGSRRLERRHGLGTLQCLVQVPIQAPLPTEAGSALLG